MMNDDTTAKILAWMGRRRAKTFAAAVAAVDGDATLVDATTAPTATTPLAAFEKRKKSGV